MQIADIITRLGGASKASVKLGLNRTTIQMWKSRGHVPPGHVPAVARALGVPAEAVWPALSAKPHPQQEAA